MAEEYKAPPDVMAESERRYSRPLGKIASIAALAVSLISIGFWVALTVSNQVAERTHSEAEHAAHLDRPTGFQYLDLPGFVFIVSSVLAAAGVVCVAYYVGRSSRISSAQRDQAMRELEDSQQRLLDFAVASSDWFWEMDAELRFTYLSDRNAEILGDMSSKYIGMRRQDVMKGVQEDPEVIAAHFRDLEERKPFRNFTYRTADSQGTSRVFRVSGIPVYDGDEFVGYRGTGSDVTAEAEANQRAEQASTRLTEAIETISEGFILYDADGHIVLCNSRLKEMFPTTAHLHVPGVHFEDICRWDYEHGLTPESDMDFDTWIAKRKLAFQGKSEPFEMRTPEGLVLLSHDYRTHDGGLVGIRTDITARRESEQALARSEEYYRSLIEDSLDMIIVTDASRHATYVSPSVNRITGHEVEDISGFATGEFVHEDDRQSLIDGFKQAVDNGSSLPPIRYRLRFANGDWRILESHGRNLLDHPIVKGFVIISRDVTDQIAAEDALETARLRLQTIIENAPLIMWSVDTNGVIGMSEGSALSLIGLKPGEIVGANVFDLYADNPQAIWGIRSALKGESVTATVPVGDLTFDSWFIPMTTGSNEIVGAIGVSLNVTERQKAEDVLRQIAEGLSSSTGEEFYRSLIESIAESVGASAVFVGLIDESGESVTTLAAYLYGDFVENHSYDIAGTPSEMVIGSELFLYKKGLQEEFPDDADLVRKGIESYVGVPLFDSNGGSLGLISVMFNSPIGDASALEALLPVYAARAAAEIERQRSEASMLRAKEEAELADRAKSEFLANMSHELRTPLNAIIGFSEMMRSGYAGALEEQQKGYATDITNSGEHLLQIINDILDLSKIEAGEQVMNEEPVEISIAVTSALRIVQERARAAKLDLRVDIQSGLPALLADDRMVKQILINLLSNAVKFTPPRGHVTVVAKQDDDGSVVIDVVDDGIGMAPEDIPVALSPFGQVESAFEGQYPGTGLGLPLVQSLAEMHGASLGIESEPGKGTRVRVTFPPERNWISSARSESRQEKVNQQAAANTRN